jgi:hypothetical protein
MAICSALPGQLLHQADKAAVLMRLAAQQVSGRHFHVGEEQLRGVLRLQAQLLQPLAGFKARHAALHQHQAGALGARRRVGLGHHDDQVGMPAVGDEGLAAVEQVAAVGCFRPWSSRPAGREPAAGSLMAMAPTISPLASFGRYFCFCASVP